MPRSPRNAAAACASTDGCEAFQPNHALNLTGVPETMLWTLHNRASEAKREDAILRDAEAVRIYESIAYDYEKSFGEADGSHAMRSRVFDDAVKPWMAAHPGGTVVELACGLETQFQRLDDGQVRWVYRKYLAFLHDARNGFSSMTIPFKSGTEYSVRAGGQRP